LAVDVLGYSAGLERKILKRKVKTCAGKLSALGVVDPSKGVFDKQGKNVYVQFHRGDYLDREQRVPRVAPIEELPIYEQWLAIGVDADGMQYLKRNFRMELLQQWADITLAARERHGLSFFERSMAAYYIDNVKAAKKDGRSPPDWWHEFKKQELLFALNSRRQSVGQMPQPSRREFLQWLQSDGRKLYEETLRKLFESVEVHGQVSAADATAVRRKADGVLWSAFLEKSGSLDFRRTSK
jgi:hypothetical protein